VPFGRPLAVLALLVVLAVCAGCGSSGSSNVSPANYITAVCSAISPLMRDVASRSQALKSSTSASAAQAKTTLEGFLAAIERDSDAVLAKIRAARTPDISNGKTVAATIVTAFTELRDAMHAAAAKASSLPTDSAASYNAAAQALIVSVKASLDKIGQPGGFSNPDIEKAAAKDPACKNLSG
jgi:hypothetical protein